MKLTKGALALALAMLWPMPATANHCHADEFRAMTYNIRLDLDSDGPNRWANRRTLLAGQVRFFRPEILGMQEVLPEQYDNLVADLPGYVAVGGGRDDGRRSGEASPLFVARSRFAVLESGMFWLSPTPDRPSLGWDAAYRRIATWAHLRDRKDGSHLLVVNTHWDHVGKIARLNSAALLQQWIAAHRGRGESVILLGDFNASLSEDSLKQLVGSGAGLTDSRAVARDVPLGATITFNGWNPVPTSGETIDHILVGGGVSIDRYHVVAEQFDGRLASDHFPVIVDAWLNHGRCPTD